MIVFLWWAWAGLSALVNIFYDLGFKNIAVVDKYKSEISEKLEKKWIPVFIWDWVYNFSNDDIIIYSDAVVNSKDFQKIKNNIKFSYFDFVGEISKRFQTISIAWTHGKTSTTSMLISSLKKSNFNKLWLGIVWWFVPDLDNKNYYINPNKKDEIKIIFEKILTAKWKRPTEYFKELYFIVEADEFNRHFLLLDSYISGITKVDHDHKDIYPTEKDYLSAFELFINKTRKKVFTNDEEFLKKINNNQIINTNNLVKLINFDYIFWEHMKKNAALALAIMKEIWLKEKQAIESIKSFKWVWRRQEYLWLMNNEKLKKEKIKEKDYLWYKQNSLWYIKIYTDYAHHPVEIQATYDSFRKNFPDKKLIAVFQPHQLFRFVSYEKNFLNSLKNFDEIFIYNIYSVREEKLIDQLIKEKNLKVKNHRQAIEKIWQEIAWKLNGKYIKSFDELIKNIQDKDWILIIMSAWNLDYEMRKFLKKS